MRPNYLPMVVPIAALVTLSTFSGLARADDSFTIEQVQSAPFPSLMVAAPSGDRVAWLFNDRGRRNIWIAEAPDFDARPITDYTEDDGQEISSLGWLPDASAIVYVRGGPPNRDGEIPNPLSLPDGAKREIWIASTGGGAPRRLAEGAAPAVSPGGESIAFLQGGAVWTVSTSAEGDEATEPEKLLVARGTLGTLRYSSDSAKLAFVSNRGDHNFIGVLNLSAKEVIWLDPSVDRDMFPVWSPDGTKVAFIRVPASSRRFAFGPRREGQPWSICVADAATGEGREVFRAREGPGSVLRVLDSEEQLFWTDSNRIVFPWEPEGWTHLYSVKASGGKPKRLTPGRFEVEHIAMGPKGRWIYFSSNQDDIDRRHLWRVHPGGKKLEALTGGEGIEWSPAPLSDGQHVALLRSDARRPARPAVLRTRGGAPRDLARETMPDDFPSEKLVEPRAVKFTATDGMKIPGQLFLPPDHREGVRHPAMLFFHGGSRRQMLLGWHYGDYYHKTYGMNQYLASRGYVVLSVNYRSGIGYGMEFREALDYGATGATEFQDVVGAGLYLQSRADVDPERIGLWGGSYGGYLTALGLARASDLFAAGVDIHGVHDWNVVIRNFVPEYDPAKQAAAARLAFESSPLADVETWRSPVLLIHGDDDRNVPFSETVRLAEALRKQNVEFEQLIYPDDVHSFLTHEHFLEVFHRADQFLYRHLKER